MKNRIPVIAFILVTAAVGVAYIGLRHYSDFKHENYLKPAIARNDIIKIMTAVLIYEQEQGDIPPTSQFELIKNYQPETEVVYPKVPEIDPWGRPYIYKVPGNDGFPYLIITYGADGTPGGAGKDQDILSDPVYERNKSELDNLQKNESE